MATVDTLITYTFPLLGTPPSSASSTKDPLSNITNDSTTDLSASPTNAPPSTTPDDTTNTTPSNLPEPLLYTHPLPTSLLAPPIPGSPQYATYTSELTDILTTLNHLHHAAALIHLLPHHPVCSNPTCPAPATDLLKSATPMLALVEPIIVVACAGVCASVQCGSIVRGLLTAATNKKSAGPNPGGLKEIQGKEGCAQCGRKQGGAVRKCGGCGVVRYCGEKCQRRGWRRGHREVCGGLRAMAEKDKEKGAGEGEKGQGGKEGDGYGDKEMEEVGDPEDELWEE